MARALCAPIWTACRRAPRPCAYLYTQPSARPASAGSPGAWSCRAWPTCGCRTTSASTGARSSARRSTPPRPQPGMACVWGRMCLVWARSAAQELVRRLWRRVSTRSSHSPARRPARRPPRASPRARGSSTWTCTWTSTTTPTSRVSRFRSCVQRSRGRVPEDTLAVWFWATAPPSASASRARPRKTTTSAAPSSSAWPPSGPASRSCATRTPTCLCKTGRARLRLWEWRPFLPKGPARPGGEASRRCRSSEQLAYGSRLRLTMCATGGTSMATTTVWKSLPSPCGWDTSTRRRQRARLARGKQALQHPALAHPQSGSPSLGVGRRRPWASSTWTAQPTRARPPPPQRECSRPRSLRQAGLSALWLSTRGRVQSCSRGRTQTARSSSTGASPPPGSWTCRTLRIWMTRSSRPRPSIGTTAPACSAAAWSCPTLDADLDGSGRERRQRHRVRNR
mmetsp:Transcript_11952/g.35447  ORF Transcript_11952/g.35447 Transcript_11952/m.35447 type:complete len:453 (-) Transcript_11952:302-1660(-)